MRELGILQSRCDADSQSFNPPVKTQHFGENEDKNHTDEQTRLLASTAHTRVTGNADGVSGSKTGETDRKAGSELHHAREERLVGRQVARNEHTDDEPVDTNDTSHDDGHNGLHDELGVHDTHRGDTDGRLCRAVGGTKACLLIW